MNMKYEEINLRRAASIRPTLMSYTLALDDAWMCGLARRVHRSVNAGRRPGQDWLRAVELQASDDVWVTREQLRPLDDVCTKFVTTKFLPDAFARVNLMGNVLRVYNRLAALSRRDFDIVFKGGVAQRLLLLEFWSDMPFETRRRGIEYLAKHKAIGISDMDFEISSHESGDADKHKIIILTYATLLWLQATLARELASGTNGMLYVTWDRKLGAEELRTDLQRVVDDLDAKHPLHGATVDHVVIGRGARGGRPGYVTRSGRKAPAPRRNLVVFVCGEHSCIADATSVFEDMGITDVPTRMSGGDLYATCNYYINEASVKQRKEELRAVFHLSRIKHTFTMYYTTRDGHKRCDRLAGELIDVSQTDPKDELGMWYRKQLQRRSPYRTYPIVGVSDVALQSYTLELFLLNHVAMMHFTEVVPWEVMKVAKRLLRYVAFLIAHVLSTDVRGSYARKVAALRALVVHTSSWPKLTSGPELRTGIDAVDDFARRERAALAPHTPTKKSRAYLSAIHTHLDVLVSLLDLPPTWNTKVLNPNHAWHTDHITTA